MEPKNAKQARNLWNKSGKLLIVERARLNTYTVLSTYLSETVLSNVWWPIKVEDDIAKILAIWMNSTFGLLLLLSTAEVTQGPWVDFKKEFLQEMPILDIRKLRKIRTNLLELYEKSLDGKKLSKSQLKAIPEEFAHPLTRKVIDNEICETLDLDLKLDALYKLLSKEPMLTG